MSYDLQLDYLVISKTTLDDSFSPAQFAIEKLRNCVYVYVYVCFISIWCNLALYRYIV